MSQESDDIRFMEGGKGRREGSVEDEHKSNEGCFVSEGEYERNESKSDKKTDDRLMNNTKIVLSLYTHYKPSFLLIVYVVIACVFVIIRWDCADLKAAQGWERV